MGLNPYNSVILRTASSIAESRGSDLVDGGGEVAAEVERAEEAGGSPIGARHVGQLSFL